MVKIRLFSNAENCFSAFESSGHAISDTEGKPEKGGNIVCAAVTILLKTAVLSLSSAQKESSSLKAEIRADNPGYLSAKVTAFSDDDRPELQYLLKFLTIGLMAIEAEYPDCLDLQIA
ncbi:MULTISPECIES: ribosomal-processing cysteine protease Prp [unclassified Treponema]|uniref:ribosomal-processing cysteine protease Prp n=1 Tax=unclassified Treponema TaxID=2638727 RepID=UPI0020A3AA01|nr:MULTISPECIES: ribosomal-processing cysteine protease Prp [unclassified Treponema]UTC67920.1 ribosomal-processing cysteine protease Prp [Treponema sp. OMZ 789]UTC70641.1 ribosomal-processing cysteine protease Prp [Treponema sp. OMZ 790]UTC73365.1 ribosomal-processing cysteine protease Prp [Treponema sp. OMZ 791]